MRNVYTERGTEMNDYRICIADPRTDKLSAVLKQGTLINVVNKLDQTSISGTMLGIQDDRVTIRTAKGNVRSFSTTAGLWAFRYMIAQ
jgi:hypothetical protein